MTRQEAIEVFKHTIAYESDFAEAKQMAIEALKKEPSEDCISREYILGEAFASDEYNRDTKSFDLPVVSVSDIEDAPSVVPSREEGEWVHLAGIGYRCSNCNEYTKSEKPFHKPKGNYCPNCGARMKGADDEV